MRIVNTVVINATPEEVFRWLEDPDRAMQWMTGVTGSEIVHETPDRVGTTFREYVEENGRGVEMRGVITEFVPNERFAVHLESDLSTVAVTFILVEEDGMTRLTHNVDLRLKGMLNLLGIFQRSSIKKKIRGQAERDFAKLKQLCKQGGQTDGLLT